MADGRFWVSTGDIHERYEVLNIVSASLGGWAVAEPDFVAASRELVDRLATAAQQIGANGVIWIQIIPVDKADGLGYALYATGTAVRVTQVP